MDKGIKKLKTKYIYGLSFIIPIIILALVYSFIGLCPIGNKSITVGDMHIQYVSFFAKLRDILHGDGSIMYSFGKSIGGNFFGIFAYYLASPLNIILYFFPKEYISEALTIITLLKIGVSALTFSVLLNYIYKKNNFSVVIFSSCYGLMAYNIAFNQNIMWLDGVMLLPLIILGLNKCIKENKYILYIFTLALAIISNYYIGYMICIFLVLYFLYITILEKSFNLKNIIKFIWTSILSAGISSCVLIPTYLSLKNGKATFRIFEESVKFTLKPIDILEKLFIGSFSTNEVLFGNPNIYCGLIILILLIIYFLNKHISKREKLLSIIFIILMLISFSISTFVLIWHGFDYPVGFNYRNSFLLTFLSIYLSYKAYVNISYTTNKELIITIVLTVLMALVVIFSDDRTLSIIKIMISLALIIGYVIFIKLYLLNTRKRKLILSVIGIVVLGELALNSYLTLVQMPYYNKFYIKDYVNNVEPLVEKAKENMDNFYRIEETFANTFNDALFLNYNGFNHSSSTFESNIKTVLSQLGYKIANSYSGYNKGSTIAIDSILAAKYLIVAENQNIYQFCNYYNIGDFYNCLSEVKTTDLAEGYKLYENPYALPIAFMVSDDIKNLKLNKDNIFEYTNEILNLMSNSNEAIYSKLSINNIDLYNAEESMYKDEIKYSKVDGEQVAYIEYTIEAEDENPIYMFLKSNLYEEGELKDNLVEIEVNGNLIAYQFNGTGYNIEPLGAFNKGEEINIKVYLKNESVVFKEPQIYSCNMEKLKTITDNLQQNIITDTYYKDGYIKGNIKVGNNKNLLYTSIPYDEGWKITVDDEEVEYFKLLNGFIALDLEEGDHILEFKYITPGIELGLTITVVSIIILLIIIVINKKLYINK